MTCACVGKREKKGGIPLTIDMPPTTLSSHTPHREEDNMDENNSRWQLGLFGRQITPHEPSETRVSIEMDRVFGNEPIVLKTKI